MCTFKLKSKQKRMPKANSIQQDVKDSLPVSEELNQLLEHTYFVFYTLSPQWLKQRFQCLTKL